MINFLIIGEISFGLPSEMSIYKSYQNIKVILSKTVVFNNAFWLPWKWQDISDLLDSHKIYISSTKLRKFASFSSISWKNSYDSESFFFRNV